MQIYHLYLCITVAYRGIDWRTVVVATSLNLYHNTFEEII